MKAARTKLTLLRFPSTKKTPAPVVRLSRRRARPTTVTTAAQFTVGEFRHQTRAELERTALLMEGIAERDLPPLPLDGAGILRMTELKATLSSGLLMRVLGRAIGLRLAQHMNEEQRVEEERRGGQ
jgi:hypothetical protein